MAESFLRAQRTWIAGAVSTLQDSSARGLALLPDAVSSSYVVR